jgi:hypothetical protein
MIGIASGSFSNSGNFNVFIGAVTGWCNIADYNINVGHYAGRYTQTGADNTFIGRRAGYTNNSGGCNVFIGRYAGCCVTRGCNNILIGCGSGVGAAGLANLAGECNRIIMGNSSHACAQIQIAWTAVSDCRDKCIFGRVPHGRGFLQNIEPIEYSFKDRESGCITDPDGKRRYGFSAQNVLAAEGDTPVVVSADNPDKLQITSDYIVPILVNAVNELSAELESLKARVAALETV